MVANMLLRTTATQNVHQNELECTLWALGGNGLFLQVYQF